MLACQQVEKAISKITDARAFGELNNLIFWISFSSPGGRRDKQALNTFLKRLSLPSGARDRSLVLKQLLFFFNFDATRSIVLTIEIDLSVN